MLALITGASSGIGRDMARVLSNKGYDLILVARDKNNLKKLQEELTTNVDIISMDLSNVENCKNLYEQVKDKNIDILINNAGFGSIGAFRKTDMNKELSMIDLNIKAVHVLTKFFLNDFVKRDSGYILNVSSASAFQPGPLMATYYSTKCYVYHLTLALYEELRRMKSNVKVSCLCPGPVNTNFNKVANCEFTIDKMFKNKLLIIPGFKIKLLYIFGRFVPNKLRLRITYNIQHRKTKH